MKDDILLQYIIDISNVALAKRQEATEYLAALRARIAELEAQNKRLRDGLTEIAGGSLRMPAAGVAIETLRDAK